MERIGALTYDEEKHEYRFGGWRVPSVTEILSPITADGYSKINPAVLEHAAMKGTVVHDWCQLYDFDCADEFMPTEIAPYCQAYMDFVRDYKPQWEKIEEIIYCADRFYAGRLDRYGIIQGRESVVDIKTIANPTTKNHISVCCQTAAYAYAIDPVGMPRRYALYLQKDGTYKLFDCEKYEEKNNFSGERLFFRLKDICETINKIGRRKGNGK